MKTTGRMTAALLGLAVLAAGCRNGPGAGAGDPLLGLGSPAALPYPGRPSVAAATGVAPGEVPPVPAAPTSTSPAALAAGPAPAVRPEAATAVEGPKPLSGVTASLNPPTGTTPVAAGGPAGGLSYEQVQQELRARGVAWQQLKMTGKPDEWHFICAIPSPTDPYTRRNYEFSAVGADGLNAMRAVLEQIKQDRP